jgi:hypothetical protein
MNSINHNIGIDLRYHFGFELFTQALFLFFSIVQVVPELQSFSFTGFEVNFPMDNSSGSSNRVDPTVVMVRLNGCLKINSIENINIFDHYY